MTKKKKITIINKFHKRETYIFAEKYKKRLFISKSQYDRMWRKICKNKKCLCSIDVIDDKGNSYCILTLPYYMREMNKFGYELELEY